MHAQPFHGDTKHGVWFLKKGEQKLRDLLVPLVPSWLQTYHLTLSSVIWSAAIVVFSFFGRVNIHWLWLVCVMIVLQYITDLLDGEIGRRRNTGLIRWGFYMDHFLDYIFLVSVLIGYSLVLAEHFRYTLFFVQAIFVGFMVHSYLAFSATNKFVISFLGFGPTEIRLVFILINIMLIVFGKTYLAFAVPGLLIIATLGLAAAVYKTQRALWRRDKNLL